MKRANDDTIRTIIANSISDRLSNVAYICGARVRMRYTRIMSERKRYFEQKQSNNSTELMHI